LSVISQNLSIEINYTIPEPQWETFNWMESPRNERKKTEIIQAAAAEAI